MTGPVKLLFSCCWSMIIVCTAGCSDSPDLETARAFQDAEDAFAEAQTSDDYARVAARHEAFLSDEFISGMVLYNQGNAWMQAGETGRAIAAWRQAQRYRPRDVYLVQNLQTALDACHSPSTIESDNGIPGYLFFWQNWLSYREKYLLATILLVGTSAVLIAWPMLISETSLRRAVSVLALFTALAVVSAVWDWHRYDQTVHGVVVVDTVEARKGNSDSYEAAFTTPLTEGTEFVVLEERNSWLNIRITNLGTAWIPRRSAVTY